MKWNGTGKALAVLAVVAVALLLLFSSDGEEIRDVGQYLQVESFVEQQLSDRFDGLMPSSETIPADAVYSYSYQAPVFGDPSFCIYLRCNYTSEEFSAECSRMLALCGQPTDLPTGEEVYIVQFSGMADGYFDDMIHDGASFYFGLAYADGQACTITYLAAMETDGRKSDTVYSMVKPLYRSLS